MLKKIIKSLSPLLLIFIFPALVFASAKMEVKIGEEIILNVQKVDPSANYKWVVKGENEILNTQTGTIFNYTFNKQGEYDVNLVSANFSGKVIKSTTISVLAGDHYKGPVSSTSSVHDDGKLSVLCSTLPVQKDDDRIHLIGNSRVLFNIQLNRSDILEYRIDKNIFKDTDGNGVANDDIDNSGDDSYLKGGSWQTAYELGDASKIVAEITIVTKTGEKAKKQIEVVFDDAPSRNVSPLAKLELTPQPDSKTNLVHLTGDGAMVGFYSRLSHGDIAEYRIDKNIFKDTNGDGDPANDIDNLNDISFKTGDVWETSYQKASDQIIAQLIVVSKEGKGSRIQRGITFSDKPLPDLSSDEAQNSIRLTSDKPFVLKGAPIKFIVEGLTLTLDQYTFAWDFDGDGVVDKEIEADNAVEHIYDFAGVLNPKVLVSDKNSNSAELSMEVLVKDLVSTMADFEFTIKDGNAVEFTNHSIAALNLTDKSLVYAWNFGDVDEEGYIKQKDQTSLKDPTYTYSKAGTYLVSLIIVDSDQVTDTKTTEVIIENDLIIEDSASATIKDSENVDSSDAKEGGSIILTIAKIGLYLILIVLGLVALIVGGFLVFLKVQHPDLTFEELVDELKIKILTVMGVHEMIDTPGVETEGHKNLKTEGQDANSDNLASEISDSVSANNSDKQAPMPDWLKQASSEKLEDKPKKEFIEGEVEGETTEEQKNLKTEKQDVKPNPQSQKEESGGKTEESKEKSKDENSKPKKSDSNDDSDDSPRPVNQKGPVPDWLKGV